MKTTIIRTAGVVFSAGILLTSCVSSKKYHKSQDEVAKLRTDSTTLAQQGSTLQQNVTSMEQKNTQLQKSVETANTTNAGLQKNVAYYNDYADKQQTSTTQIKDELTTTLVSAGLTEQDVMQTDGKIYINIGEKSLFKGNSTVLTAKGKELVDNLGQFVKSHEAVDISVADLEMATASASDNTALLQSSGQPATDMNQNNSVASDGVTNSASANNNNAVTENNTAGNNNADYSRTGTAVKKKPLKKVAGAHHTAKTQTVAGERKATTYSSGRNSKSYTSARNSRSMARAIAWKRQNVVADALLKNGIPKVKVVAQLPGTGNTPANSTKGVQVVLVNDMDNFYKHMSQAPAGQPVTKNP